MSLALLGWLVRTQDAAQFWQVVRGCRWELCAVTLVLLVTLRTVTAYKWKLLLAAQHVIFSFRRLLQSVWTSNFFGYFLPTTAGADGVRAYSFSRVSGRLVETASSVLMERITGAVALVALSVFGAVWSLVVWGRGEILHVVVVPIAVVLLLVGAVWHPALERNGRRAFERLRWVPGRGVLLQTYASIHAYRYDFKTALAALALSFVLHGIRVLSVFTTAKALGLSLSLVECLAIVPAVLLVSMLPISIGSWGIQEGSFVFLMKLAGLEASASLGLALLWRALSMIADLPGLVWFWIDGLGRAVAPALAPEAVEVFPASPVGSKKVW